jgi:hypothetical protein
MYMDDLDDSHKEVKVVRDERTDIYRESHVRRADAGDIHVMTREEEEFTVKARRAGYALQDLFSAVVDRARAIAKEKTEQLAKTAELGPGAITATKDARDIATLGPMVLDLAKNFEDVMTNIRGQSYDDQVKLLTGYKKLLEEHITIIDSRIHFVERVK